MTLRVSQDLLTILSDIGKLLNHPQRSGSGKTARLSSVVIMKHLYLFKTLNNTLLHLFKAVKDKYKLL